MILDLKPMTLFDFYSLHLHLLTWFFRIFFIAQTADYKANIQCILLSVPSLEGNTEWN